MLPGASLRASPPSDASSRHRTTRGASHGGMLEWSWIGVDPVGVEPKPGSNQHALRQAKPFRSRRQEALVGLLLTA
ncbi:MAG: hypothetical protein RL112_2731 [Planctomycetota bacterium]